MPQPSSEFVFRKSAAFTFKWEPIASEPFSGIRYKIMFPKLVMVAHSFNTSTESQRQVGLCRYRALLARAGYMVKPSLRRKQGQ